MSPATVDKAVIETAKEEKGMDGDGIVTLSTGVRVRIKPVSASLIQEVVAKIEYPDVPKWHNPEKGRVEDNPLDPDYRRKVAQVSQDRGKAALDALAMFGVELADGLPEDETWIRQLNLLGITFDDNPVDKKYYYTKHIAVGNMDDWNKISRASGVTEEGIAAARASFPSDQE